MILVSALNLSDGTLVADLSPHIVDGVRWSRGKHDSRDLICDIRASDLDRLNWLARIGSTEIRLTSQYGEVLWSGRLEEVELTDDGAGLTAYGHWAALNDVLYTALWSDANVGNWLPLTANDLATIDDALWMYDQQNRLYVAPTVTNTFGDADFFVWGYIAPSGGARQLTDLDFDYVLAQNGDTDWRVSIDRCDSSWAVLGNIGTITTDSSGSKNYSFTGCDRVAVTFYRNNAVPAALSGDAGTVYFKMTSVRIATASSVPTSTIVAAMATYTNGVNSNHLSSVTARVATTTDDLHDYEAADARPGELIDDLLESSDTGGKFYEAGVDTAKRLYMRERHSQSQLFIADVGELTFGMALADIENSVYAVYQDANGRAQRSSAATSTASMDQIGMTRHGMTRATSTTSLATAQLLRTDALALNSKPAPMVRQLQITGLGRPDGSPARFYELRHGDRLRIAGLPLYAYRRLGDLYIDEVVFSSENGGAATVTLLDRSSTPTTVTYSPLTVYASEEGATTQWTANTGTKIAAVAPPDDDITTYVSSSTTINQIQQLQGKLYTFVIPPAATVTQVTVTYRIRRGGAIDADCVVGYYFLTPTGSQSGTSGTITATSSWAGGTYTHSGLSARWNGGFYFYVQNTQARNVFCSTLYAEITYTNPT